MKYAKAYKGEFFTDIGVIELNKCRCEDFLNIKKGNLLLYSECSCSSKFNVEMKYGRSLVYIYNADMARDTNPY